MDLISSLNKPLQIEAFGFDQADEAAHMIPWLGRGGNFRQFVINDVEGELYAQTPGAQLLSISCKGPLQLETKAMPQGPDGLAMVTGFSVTFPLSLRIRTSDEALWKLDIEQNYHVTNMHLQDGRRSLTQNFTVVGHERAA
jgi:hypothetical protein